MPIPSNIPSNIRRPGDYHEFDFSAGGQQLAILGRRIVIVAEKSPAGTAAADTPIQIFGEVDGDTKLGKGSLAALMNRVALLQAKLSDLGQCEIWACPLAEPGGGIAAQYTLTFGGTATEAKDLIVDVAGRLIIVGVNIGDAAATVATAVKNKFDELKEVLPVTAGVAGAVVTLTFLTKGVNGNDVRRTTVQLPAGITLAHAASVAGAGATSITAALGALYNQRYHGICLANHVTTDAATLLADAALAWGYAQKSYRFYAMGERGSLGTAQTLQASFNDYRFLFATCEGAGSLPGEMATAMMMAWMVRDDPNANLDDERLGIYPPSATDAYTASELESALSSGLTPLEPDGPYVKITRLVTTQITLAGVPFEPLREPALPRTGAEMAEQVGAGYRQGFRQEVLYDDPDGGDDIFQRIRDMVIGKHRAAQRRRWIRDVDSFLSEIKAEPSPNVTGRVVVQDPMRVAGPLHQGAFLHTMYLL